MIDFHIDEVFETVCVKGDFNWLGNKSKSIQLSRRSRNAQRNIPCGYDSIRRNAYTQSSRIVYSRDHCQLNRSGEQSVRGNSKGTANLG